MAFFMAFMVMVRYFDPYLLKTVILTLCSHDNLNMVVIYCKRLLSSFYNCMKTSGKMIEKDFFSSAEMTHIERFMPAAHMNIIS